MSDLTRLISRLDDLTRRFSELEAEHAALREDHRLLKMKVEELEQRNAKEQTEICEVAPYYPEDAYERFRKWNENNGRGAALALLQKDKKT